VLRQHTLCSLSAAPQRGQAQACTRDPLACVLGAHAYDAGDVARRRNCWAICSAQDCSDLDALGVSCPPNHCPWRLVLPAASKGGTGSARRGLPWSVMSFCSGGGCAGRQSKRAAAARSRIGCERLRPNAGVKLSDAIGAARRHRCSLTLVDPAAYALQTCPRAQSARGVHGAALHGTANLAGPLR